MDRMIDRLPLSLRQIIRTETYKTPQTGEIIKKDALDYRAEYKRGEDWKEIEKNLGIEALVVVAVCFGDIVVNDPSTIESKFGTMFGAGGSVLSNVFRVFKRADDEESRRSNERRSRVDAIYQGGVTQAWHLRYVGKSPLETGSVRLEKGDNFFYIKLGEINRAGMPYPIPPELLIEWYQTVDRGLSIFREDTSDEIYKAVAIELPEIEMPTGSLDVKPNKSTRGEVFKGKKTPIKDKNTRLLLLSREDFEALTVSPAEVLYETAKELGDKTISTLLQTVDREIIGSRENQKLRQMVFKRADQILRQEIEANFNGPERIWQRDDQYIPWKVKVQPFSRLAQTPRGFSLIQTIGLTGEVRSKTLNRLLKVREDLPSMVKAPGKYKRAQMAYLVHQIIKHYDESALMRYTGYNRKVNLKDRNLDIEQLVDTVKEDKDRKKYRFMRYGRSFLSAIVMYAALKTAITAGLEYSNLFKEQKSVRNADFPLGVPTIGLDWKLSGEKTDGYYAYSTSHEFKAGRWEENRVLTNSYTLPEKVEEKQSLVHVQKLIPLTQFGDTRIKIPVRTDTRLVAIQVKDVRGEIILAKINEYNDGTYELNIPFSLTASRAWIEVDATMEPTTERAIHATQKITPLDEKKLTEEAINYVALAKEVDPDHSTHVLAAKIRTSKQYSINPPGAEEISKAITSEEYVNAQTALEYCDCVTCNTLLALGSTLDPDSLPVNLAHGYIALDNHISGKSGGYLRNEAGHAFAVDFNGTVIDATSSTPANDKETQEYLKILHGDRNAQGNGQSAKSDEEKWSEKQGQVKVLAEKEKQSSDLIKIIGSGLGTIAMASVIMKSAKVLAAWRGRKKEEDDHKSGEQKADPSRFKPPEYKESLFAGLTNNDVQRVANFLSWVSFGNLNKPTELDKSYEQKNTRDDTFDHLRRNVNPIRIEQYLKDPGVFENHYGLTPQESGRLRQVAKYLVG